MTAEIYDNLASAVGRKMTNREWKNLLAEEFGVSKTCAKTMLHLLLNEKDRNEFIRRMMAEEDDLK